MRAAIVRPLQSESGVALMMVLWIFMVLTVLVAEFGRGMRDDAIATQNMAEEVQARGVALAGIGQGIYRSIRAREEPSDEVNIDDDVEIWPADGSWHEGHYGGGTYSVRLIDEGGKIPLNRSDEQLLRRVLSNVGLDADAQEAIADAILDWRDEDDLKRLHGAEADYYLGLPEPYAPKNGRFDATEELLLVRGVTREMLFGTPSGGGLGRNDQPTVARRLVDRKPSIVAVDARAVMEGAQVQARVGAIVKIEEDSEGFHIERWYDRLPAL